MTGANGQLLGDSVDPGLDPNGLLSNGGPTQPVALLWNSPAIDAVSIGLCPLTDQRGFPRPDSSIVPSVAACDVGEYEFSASVVNSLADNAIAGDGLCTLREAINNANADAETTEGDCAMSSAIVFSVSGQITLGSTLPPITGNASINGSAEDITVDGANSFQVMHVNTGGSLNLNDLTIADGNSGVGSCSSDSESEFLNVESFISSPVVRSLLLRHFANLAMHNVSEQLASTSQLPFADSRVVETECSWRKTLPWSFENSTKSKSTGGSSKSFGRGRKSTERNSRASPVRGLLMGIFCSDTSRDAASPVRFWLL
jgi:CSLREA domain-containing protein